MPLFNIKLISGNNLVLVESPGYEAEIFQPEIIDGVICLNNVVKYRNKSPTVLRDNTNKIKILTVQHLKNASDLTSDSGNFHPKDICNGTATSTKNSLVSSEHFSTNSVETPPAIRASSKSPVKHSTPVLLSDLVSDRNLTSPYNNFLYSRGNQQETPSPILYYSSFNSLNKSKPKIVPLSTLGPNLKIVKLYRKSTGSQRQVLAKIVHTSNTEKENNITFATPLKSARKPSGPKTPATVTKWRKCITPAKTYSKRGHIQRRQLIIRSTKKVGVPSYIPNPTVGIEGSAELTVKTIRTIIDQRTTIRPQEFKQQMKSSDDLKNTYLFDFRTKEKLYHARFSAFDLLVNPARKKSFSKDLHRMFRTRCTSKSAPVEPVYETLLDDIPPLDYIPPVRKSFKF